MQRWEGHESKQGRERGREQGVFWNQEAGGKGEEAKWALGPNPEELDWHASHLSGHDSVGTRETSEASEQGVMW